MIRGRSKGALVVPGNSEMSVAFQPQDEVRVLFDPAGHPFCLYVNG